MADSAILHLPSSLYGGGSSLRRRGIRAETEIRDTIDDWCRSTEVLHFEATVAIIVEGIIEHTEFRWSWLE